MKTIIINNKTHYFTKDLEKIFKEVLVKYKRVTFDFKFKTVRVTCIYRKTKDGFCGGYAWYNDNEVVMKLPKIKMGYGSDTFEQRLARTFHHELDHCRGKRHGDMVADKHRDVSYINDEFLVRVKKPIEKRKKTNEDKIKSIWKRIESWSSKKKRAENAIKKLTKQVKYYQKKNQNAQRSIHKETELSEG